MQLEELTAYAREKYQIEEQHKWSDFPGFSVLCHPKTGKWIALLMRQWDTDTGEEIERCDIKCGLESLASFRRPYLAPPIRMHSDKWISVAFGRDTEEEIVFRLLDKAVSAGNPSGYTLVLESPGSSSAEKAGQNSAAGPGAESGSGRKIYQETPLPAAGRPGFPQREVLPEKLRQMRHLYQYGRESSQARAQNFVRQAVFMQDYEDDVPWIGGFSSYYPTYHDLTTRQLRGYFTWRTQLRRGNFKPIATSAAYIYIYELLNGIGTASPEESLRKLQEFEEGYLDSGIGDERIRPNLHRWMLEYAVLKDLPPARARQLAEPHFAEQNAALSALLLPRAHSDEEVFKALCRLGGKKLKDSPVITGDPARGMRLFAGAYREACAYQRGGKNLFTLCFGERVERQWFPLANAVYLHAQKEPDRDYYLDDCCSYHLRNGIWRVKNYEKPHFDRTWLQGFIHETDTRLRRYLKTGRYLKENPADAWVLPFLDEVLEADRKEQIEAARPKITIDLSGLDQIREDAAVTRESLLTEEERQESFASDEVQGWAEPVRTDSDDSKPAESELIVPGLDAVQVRILRMLLYGENPAELIKESHLMPSITADAINEAFYDEIGDTVVLCEDDRLLLVDDYEEDLKELLGI
ncbi:MAG: TerB N-terminal domain-containing protein [Lachnospiraceae bacterium]|nr:TerB N-terminal domain-containing protein [Lachnospiraceae bacterium]